MTHDDVVRQIVRKLRTLCDSGEWVAEDWYPFYGRQDLLYRADLVKVNSHGVVYFSNVWQDQVAALTIFFESADNAVVHNLEWTEGVLTLCEINGVQHDPTKYRVTVI